MLTFIFSNLSFSIILRQMSKLANAINNTLRELTMLTVPRCTKVLRDVEFFAGAVMETKKRSQPLTPPLKESSGDEEIGNNYPPPNKRRKISQSKLKDSLIKQDLFTNYLDQCQYANIYQCLYEQLNIGSVIAKEIAEFATGQSKKCENYKNCNKIKKY